MDAWQLTADGPITACAPQLVGRGLRPEPAATLYLRMVARLALETRRSCAAYKHVQVYLSGNSRELPDECGSRGVAYGWYDRPHGRICSHISIHEYSHAWTQLSVAFTRQ